MPNAKHKRMPPPEHLVADAVAAALEEDLGLAGDITSNAIFDTQTTGTAIIKAREAGVLAGALFADEAFCQTDPACEITWHKQDGDQLAIGDHIAEITGPVRAILTAERTALNFLGRLTGIATLTARYAEKIKHTSAVIVDAKNHTGLRLRKYCRPCGRWRNHRFRPDDAVLIKDNHIAFAGGIKAAISKARENTGHMIKLEVEVDTLEQLNKALAEKVDAVLLDNMSLEDLRRAVKTIDGRLIAEASGGVTLDTVADIAATGVDIISVGALTHSAPCLDLGLDIDIPTA